MKAKKNTPALSPADLAKDRFSSFFKERAAAHGIVGASLRLTSLGGTTQHTTFGFKDRATGAPTDEATIYHWASITKTMTGIAILQLRDRGRLSLDDSILKYVPEAGAVHNPFGPTSAITLRQLLSHTAGLRAGTWPSTGITVSNGGLNAPLGDMEAYVRFLLGDAPTKEGAGVLSRASLEEMWKPVALVETVGEDRVDMGLCFFIEKRGGRKLIGHSGSQNGFISHLYLDLAARAGYVVSFNTDATDEVAVPNTRKLDAEISEFFVANVAPVLEAGPAKR